MISSNMFISICGANSTRDILHIDSCQRQTPVGVKSMETFDTNLQLGCSTLEETLSPVE